MSAQHTPGPWHWDSDPIKGDPLERVRFQVVTTGKTITQCYYSSGDEQAEWDARLISAAPDLLEALEAHQAAQAMPTHGDYSGFVWPKVEMRNPGETAWGWICEKHGLGYQSGCICCTEDWKRHQDDRDRAARYARDDALHEASKKARAAIAKATGSAS